MLSSTQHTLMRLAELEHGWGGSGEPPPTSQAINAVQRLAEDSVQRFGAAAGTNAAPWAIAPLDNGGLLAEWRGRGGDLELHIGPGGEIGYLLVSEHDNERSYEEADSITLSAAIQLVARVLLGKAPRD
jgi:hypothetical protein